MTSPARPSGPGQLLWPVAALLVLAGVVLLALGAAGTAGRATGDLVGFAPGQQIEVPDAGMSVWARSASTREATVCTLGETTLLRPVADLGLEVDGQRFHEVARTPDDLRPGTYAARCDTADQVYAGPYGPATTAPGIVGTTGLTLGMVLLPLALVLGLLAWLSGRRHRPRPEQGPDPAGYTLAPQATGGGYTSPYASPSATTTSPYSSPTSPYASPSSSTASPYTPPPVAPPASPPPPAGGPFSPPGDPAAQGHGLPPAPVSTGHDAGEADRVGGDIRGGGAPPSGPRYDLPPPS